MGRRGSITEDQVFDAADALMAQGREVTPTALLNALGSGSFTTIYKHLNAWEATRTSAGTERTAAIPEAVLSAFGAAWRAASAEASKEVVLVREQSAEEVKAVKAQFQEALQTIERLESESEADAARIEALNANVAELESSVHRLENEKAAYKATVDQLRHQVKSQESELERVHKVAEAERKRHQDDMAKAVSAEEKANVVIENLRKEKESAMKEAAELRGKSEELKAQNNELLSSLAEVSKSKSDEKKNR